MIMSGKQCFGFHPVFMEVFHHGPCYGNSVIGTGPPADLIEQNKAAVREVIQDTCSFVHLNHEG